MKLDNTKPLEALSAADASAAGSLSPADDAAMNEGPLLDQRPSPTPDEPPVPSQRPSHRRLVGLGLLGLGILAALLLGVRIEMNKSNDRNSSLSASQQVRPQSMSLSGLSSELEHASNSSQGVLTVNGSLVLSPSIRPSSPVPGELYYSQTTDQMQYYDGIEFVALQGSVSTTNVYENITSGGATNTTNTTSVTNSSGTGISGLAGALAMFGSNGTTLTDSLVTENGTTLNVGQTSGGGTTDVLAGTGGVSIGAESSVGTTTINGGQGGIAINSGSGGLSVNATTYHLIGTSASTLGTSSGPLALTSGGGSAGNGVIVEPENDSTTAFQVQNANGTTILLNVDTTDDEISLGTGAGSALGFAGIGQYGNGGSGQDVMSAQKVTTTSGGSVTSMTAYLGAGGLSDVGYQNFQFAIYTDSGGKPGNYLASSTIGADSEVGAWYTLPISATLDPNTTYWLVFWQNGDRNGSGTGYSININVTGAVNDVSYDVPWQSGTDNGWPITYPTIGASYAAVASLYASYASSGPALTLNAAGTMTQNGAAFFQDPTDAVQAFEIQDSLSNALFTADTADMEILVGGNLSVSGSMTLDGHIVTGGSPSTIAANAAACTSPTVSVAGDDIAGTITVTTGTSCTSSGDLATITFSAPYGTVPNVTLTPVGAAAEQLGGYTDNPSMTGFSVGGANTPTPSTTYQWAYQVMQ